TAVIESRSRGVPDIPHVRDITVLGPKACREALQPPIRATGNLRSELSKSVIEAIERLLENRTRRGKVEAQPGFAARPKLLTRACENTRPILDPCRDVFGQIGRASGRE